MAVLLLAEAGEDAAHRLRDRQQLFLGQELVEQLAPGAAPRRARRRRRARSRAGLAVHLARAAMAPRSWMFVRPQALCSQPEKAILNLRPKSWVSGWPSRKNVQRVRVGRDVERLRAADAGERAGGDVADGVAAGLARGDADGGQAAHDVGRVLDVDEVQLDVLAGGDVQMRSEYSSAQLGEHVHLLGGDLPARDLDPLHAGRVPQRARALGESSTGTRASASSTPSCRWPLS